MLLHIPHASYKLPDSFKDNDILTDAEIELHTDWHTDTLFTGYNQAVFPYSRFFCDVERLVNDPLEATGRGIAYTKTSTGEVYRQLTDTDRAEIDKLYADWHLSLKREVESQSSLLDNVVLVDCHSYSAEQVGMAEGDCPDICIGFNEDNSKLPDSLLTAMFITFSNAGYSVSYNEPYGGAVVASDLPNVYSVMIEVNKRTYLDNPSNFDKLKATIDVALKLISDFEVGISAA